MTAPTTALDRVQRFLESAEGDHAAGMNMRGEMFSITLADLREVVHLASEGIR